MIIAYRTMDGANVIRKFSDDVMIHDTDSGCFIKDLVSGDDTQLHHFVLSQDSDIEKVGRLMSGMMRPRAERERRD